MKNRRVGILGGTFNPIHIGHLIMANEAYHALGLDEVRFMPSAKSPHKEMYNPPADQDRINMISLAIKEIDYFKLELIEFDRSEISYTYDTIIQLKKREPDTEFYFIIGGDMIDFLPKWHRVEELVKEIRFIGFMRPGYTGETGFPVTFISAPMIDLSSSFIRTRLQSSSNVTFLIPQQVNEYITKEGLYES
ncbi:nicotinate-nucleotide adenylyltransferase [Jeotgalibacillus proteolyticus]|uniref:Probable nicotinate-nucleotide adenylyltransferase n=1 Tax=Jeotgalibacillus proteolyticus TaxID=2082395 RepID=A0A2S5GER3_9BACL|nr:nicotinate-nucleotide adenylyltransferase [Jeotgalibacillus proteolyticus]PPA71479.1 nicotinate-nucleotide adenylyltransferase [Jeotgalibacillus proteolyticus]